jgi:hypothetical protein
VWSNDGYGEAGPSFVPNSRIDNNSPFANPSILFISPSMSRVNELPTPLRVTLRYSRWCSRRRGAHQFRRACGSTELGLRVFAGALT